MWRNSVLAALGVALLPFVDERRLRAALEEVYPDLTPEESKSPGVVTACYYCCVSPRMSFLLGLSAVFPRWRCRQDGVFLPPRSAPSPHPALLISSRQKEQPWWWCSLCWKAPPALWLHCRTVQDQKYRGGLYPFSRDGVNGEGGSNQGIQLKNSFFPSQWTYPPSCAMGSRASWRWMKTPFFQTSECGWGAVVGARGRLHLDKRILVPKMGNLKLLPRQRVRLSAKRAFR